MSTPPRLDILLADDDEMSLDALAMFFELEGFTVRTACNGMDTLEVFEAWPSRIVLLDIKMPLVDGLAVARQIRRHASIAETVLIALTGYAGDEGRNWSREAGFDYHFIKPIEPARLLATVNGHLALASKR